MRLTVSDGELNANGERATLWNFVERTVSLPGRVCDAATGEALPCQEALPRQQEYRLYPNRVYAISETSPLFVQVGHH